MTDYTNDQNQLNTPEETETTDTDVETTPQAPFSEAEVAEPSTPDTGAPAPAETPPEPEATAEQPATPPQAEEAPAPAETPVAAQVEDDAGDGDAGDGDTATAQDAPSEEDVETTAAEPAKEPISDNGLKRGDLIEGIVIKNTPTEVLIDVGVDKPGVVNSRELEYLTKDTLDSLEETNKVWVYVLSPANREGQPVLSIGRAAEERDWQEAQEYFDSKEVYQGRVSGYNKGGLIVRFGRLRGFVPASQISPQRRAKAQGQTPEERWGEMIDEPIAVKVVEIKRSRNRLILSELAAQSEIRAQEKAQLVEELHVGEVRTGTVTSLTDFGAFVDIGGADGLVHVTELSWQHVDHPSEIVEVGEEVTVEVISLDEKKNRIGLSMRTLSEDPWDAIAEEYEVGQLTQAKVTKLTKFGAFARLLDHPEIEGLIHVSELAEHRVKHPREMVNVGDVLTLRIVKIENERRRLGLSLKRVNSAEYLDVDWQQVEEDLNEEGLN